MRSEVSRPEGYVPVGKRHSMRLVKSSHGMTVEWLTEVYQDRKFLEPGGKVARHRPAAAVPSALRLLGAPLGRSIAKATTGGIPSRICVSPVHQVVGVNVKPLGEGEGVMGLLAICTVELEVRDASITPPHLVTPRTAARRTPATWASGPFPPDCYATTHI